jgi:hypothetical protein
VTRRERPGNDAQFGPRTAGIGTQAAPSGCRERLSTRSSCRRAHQRGGKKLLVGGVEHQGVLRRKADPHGLADGMGRDRAVFENPQISGVDVDDIEDLAPHRLQLRDPAAEARASESQMFRPQSDCHCPPNTTTVW